MRIWPRSAGVPVRTVASSALLASRLLGTNEEELTMSTAVSTISRDDAERRFNWPLLALAIGAFGIGTTEFSPMGLLPVIADGVHVSIPTAGMLVSAYAIGVMLGAPVMTLAFSRFGKRTALMLLMGIFTIGNLLSAVAPGYSTLLLAR